MNDDKQRKVALVTGGGGGIGRGIIEWFADHDIDVVIGEHTDSDATRAAAAIKRTHPHIAATGIGADLGTAEGCRSLVAHAISVHQRVDILVNNAAVTGTSAVVPFLEMSDEHLDRVIDINVKAAFRCCQLVARDLIRRGEGGVLVNISSVAAYAAQHQAAAYTASKSALTGLTKALALELAPQRIRVVGVAPGDIDIAREPVPITEINPWQRSTPLARRGTPQDVAAAVGFLTSTAASFISGETIVVDGGWLTY